MHFHYAWIFILISILQSARAFCPQGCKCFHRTVRCNHQQLQEIPKFPNDTVTIDLRNNLLKSISARRFEGLNQVLTIHLNENEISYLHKESFYGLTALKNLYLNKNRIRQIPNGIFDGLPQLQALFLRGNELTTIPIGFFNNLTKLTYLYLDDNPINCDCGIHSLLGMKYTLTLISLVCQSPERLRRKQFSVLHEHDFQCTKPEIVQEPNDMEVSMGQAIELPCTVVGDPKPDIIWMHDTNEIFQDYSPKIKILDSGTLRIASVDNNDIGVYMCIGRNDIGEIKSHPITMTISNTEQSPQFTIKPKDATISLNEFAILDCSATGSHPLEVQWFFNNRPISQSSRSLKVLSNGSLEISSATLLSAGNYKCQITNSLGSIEANARIEVKELPVFILAPQNQTIKEGQSIVLECDAEGNPLPTITWHFNNKLVAKNKRIVLENEGTELVIKEAKQSDSGTYVCIAENDNGASKLQATVSIQSGRGPPVLKYGPYDLDAFSGTIIELPCKGDDDSAQVRWQKDGRIIVSNEQFKISTSGSLYIKNTTLADTGRYECSLKNEYGRATASGLVTIKSSNALAPGDKYVRVAFAEAAKEIDLAINNTIESLFSNESHSNPLHHSELLRLFRFPKGEARQLARAAEIYERTLVNIRKHVEEGHRLGISSSQYEFKDLLSREHLRLVAELSGCMEHRESPNCTDMCYHSKYRSIDGTCNNLNNPTWGASLTAFRRMEKPIYENGFSMPIGWIKGKKYAGFPKPSSRLVSTTLISTNEITPDERITHMVMQWGQFIDHDLDHAIPSVSSESWDGIDCKKTCEFAPPCYPMEVPQNDPRVKNRRCIDFIRSSAICGSGMTSVFFDEIQPREQINQLTSYIDASQVYGYTLDFAQELRNLSTDDGLLRTGVHFPNQKDMLPFAAPQDGIDCRRNLNENNMNCFVAGDIRANEQLGLLAMHTIWMREHNRIALKLKEMNPHWDGDTIYQEARKIVGSEMQHITYKHWLPIIVGPSGMKRMGEYKGYNPLINPSIANEFATAAFRFGHTLINPILHRLNETFQPIPQGNVQLHKAFFSPWRLAYEGGVDPLMRGLFSIAAKLKKPDENLNTELTEKLFLSSHAVALDLAAMNVQRGREHGIPGYNAYRKICNLTVAKTFDDLSNEISSVGVRTKLKNLYGHPDNIDLFVGGILEDQVENGKIGPLFQCIIVDQFRKLRDGDRFYYENPSVYLPEQLQQIRETNLARILCDNGDNIKEITHDVFILPQLQDGYTACDNIPGINLHFWQDCGTCDSLPALLKTHVPHFYPKRKKRAITKTTTLSGNQLTENMQYQKFTKERIDELENVIEMLKKQIMTINQDLQEKKHNFISSKHNNFDKNGNCIDISGKFYFNGETWNRDICTHCQCLRSQINCIKKECNPITCANKVEPITTLTDCCPICPN